MDIKSLIRTVPHWPKEGIMFKDITTLLSTPDGFKATIDQLIKRCEGKSIDVICGIEARGFILGGALAYVMNKGFVPIRKKGKLPGKTIKEEYQLEYGTDTIEIHEDAIKKSSKVLLVDDLLATGGTALAACNLIKKAGGIVEEICFVVDLPDLGGGKRISDAGYKWSTLCEFEGE